MHIILIMVLCIGLFFSEFGAEYHTKEDSLDPTPVAEKICPATKPYRNMRQEVDIFINDEPLGHFAEREKVKPEFEITTVVSVFHIYEDYAPLNDAWTIWALEAYPDNPEWAEDDVWGWADCEWQPDMNYAACDIHTIRPTYVRADLAMDTIGHEVWHGVAGAFHD